MAEDPLPTGEGAMSKPELRRWARELRQGLPTAELSSRVNQHLADFLQTRAAHILLYQAFAAELDPAGLMALYPASYYLPRVEGGSLHIHPLPCELVPHKYGMLEPAASSPTVPPATLQAVLVPGLCFDRLGYRLGYGKGYYDRFLSGLPPATLTIGLVPEALVLEALPKDPWDIPVRYLASETGIRPTGPEA